MNKIATYFKESYKELIEKVTWPTWAQLAAINHDCIGATLVITAIVWVMDFAAGNALKFIYSFFKNNGNNNKYRKCTATGNKMVCAAGSEW